MSFFTLEKESQGARLGKIVCLHGEIETPVFMPVGTRGSIKAQSVEQTKQLDPQIILANTYHCMLRPGKEIIQKAGGLHKFSSWDRPFLTDSGGFQVFSLNGLNKITSEGVHFQSHIDGKALFIGPNESMEMQKVLGSDIVMAFDECPPYPCSKQKMEQALDNTARWAKVCRDYELQAHQHLFGIVQGGVDPEFRRQSAQSLVGLGFDGYAIGGLSVGEPAPLMYECLEHTVPQLPKQAPRYLMGVGTPRNLLEAVLRGVDMFDCVMPTRNARNGTAFTWQGKINIKAGRYKEDFSPLDPELGSYASTLSKAYIRHLANVGEMAADILITQQNIAFYLDFMKQLRHAIRHDLLDPFIAKVDRVYPQ